MNEFAMHDAVSQNDLERVRQLIAAGVSVDSLNEHGYAPLHLAALYGHYEAAGLLIDSGCDLDITNGISRTPLMWAAEWGRKDIVDLLFHRGAQVNYCCADYCGGDTPLIYADYCGGDTPLICAARGSNEDIAILLVRAGADVNGSDEKKRTALHFAVALDLYVLINILLLKEGLDLSPQDVNGDTPLHLACKFGYRLYAVKQLLDAGANINVKNMRGRTPLSEGIEGSHLYHSEIGWFVKEGAFLENCDYKRISRHPILKENVLKNVELCTQSVVNKFNRQSLPALSSIAYFARRLPNVDNFKLGARHIDEVENLVECEIERNTFCNVVKVRPRALSALCVLSLITCQSGKKRAASMSFGHSPCKKK